WLPNLLSRPPNAGDCINVAILIPGGRTSSLGAARPFLPSADIGPGGRSVGQAAQFCLDTIGASKGTSLRCAISASSYAILSRLLVWVLRVAVLAREPFRSPERVGGSPQQMYAI